MQLKDWLEENLLTQRWMAKKLGIAPIRLHRICAGTREPTLDEVNKIYEITNRKVTWKDHLETIKQGTKS